ncbi:MAG: ACP S-malonyltransferase [Rhodoluna sp.]
MISIACPGQGSQTPGFFQPWLELPTFKKQIERSSEILGIDLIYFGTAADQNEIRDTKIAQPLIVAAGIASYAVLKESIGSELTVDATAGHSVGEITSAYVAGIFDEETALRFVQKRGTEMAQASFLTESSMAAVVGGEQESVLANLAARGLSAANYNGAGQIVAAGSKELIVDLVANAPAGTRVVQLQVAGAFHTTFMESARAPLAEYSKALEAKNPNLLIWTNRDGSSVADGGKFLDLLVNQVSNPVRWDKTMDSMTDAGVSLMIELLPGGALSGIAKRSMPNTVAIPVKTPADLDKVAEALGK